MNISYISFQIDAFSSLSNWLDVIGRFVEPWPWVDGQLKVMDSAELMEPVPTGRYKYLLSVFNRAVVDLMGALRT